MKKLENVFSKIFCVLAIVMYGLLLYYCLGITGENSGPLSDEHIYFKVESPIISMALLAAAFVVLCFVSKAYVYFETRKRRNILLAVLSVLAALFGIYWITASKTYPDGDQVIILNYARAFCEGDYYGLQKGEYLSIFPYQLGIVTVLMPFVRLFGENDYLAFQYFTALLLPAVFVSGSRIIRILANDNARAEFLYLVCLAVCFPMYAYTPFVYGDLISLEVCMPAIWMLLSCLEKFKLRSLVMFGILIGLAVLLRQHTVIVVLAIGIVLLVKFICTPVLRRQIAAVGLAMLVGIYLFQGCIALRYHDVKASDAATVPLIINVVMGLNDYNGYSGWNNWYCYNLFFANDMDRERTKQQAMEDLRSYLSLFKDNPSYMVDFFTRKMNAQWNAPMYQCIVMNSRVVGEQGKLVGAIYNRNTFGRLVEGGMKVYQLVLYGSVLVFLVKRRKSREPLEKYVLLIAVFGGFLFTMMWEAKTRYVFPYLIMQLPYMAMGANEVVSWMEARLFRRGKKI